MDRSACGRQPGDGAGLDRAPSLAGQVLGSHGKFGRGEGEVMNHLRKMTGILAAAVLASFVLTFTLFAQAPAAAPAAAQPGRAAAGRGPAGPQVVSPEVLPDRRITFRILAPQAQNVRVSGGDMPALAGAGRGATAPSGPPPGKLTKADNGVWSVTVGPVDPGAYRYNFNVDGITVIDPRSP